MPEIIINTEVYQLKADGTLGACVTCGHPILPDISSGELGSIFCKLCLNLICENCVPMAAADGDLCEMCAEKVEAQAVQVSQPDSATVVVTIDETTLNLTPLAALALLKKLQAITFA